MDNQKPSSSKHQQHNDSPTTPATNPGVMLYNVLIVVIDLVFLLSKFFYYAFESIYWAIKGVEERDVSKDIVLITGAGHGIGKELALQYSALGATVVCWDLNEQMNQDTVKKIKSNSGNAFGYTVDVTDREKVLETSSKVIKDVGTVSILIQNAGIMPQHEILKHSEGEIRKIYEINSIAHHWMMQAFLPGMVEKNVGHIVAMSSIAGLCGLPNLVPYCGSKFAVRGMMESLSEELRSTSNGTSNIKFSTVFPYMVDTGLCKKVKIRFENFMRLVKPSEAAAAIISGQRRGVEEFTIPKYMYYLNNFLRLFPSKSSNLVRDFFDSGVETDM